MLCHGNVHKPPIHEAYIVTFVEQPNFHSLNIYKDKWYNQLDAKIKVSCFASGLSADVF